MRGQAAVRRGARPPTPGRPRSCCRCRHSLTHLPALWPCPWLPGRRQRRAKASGRRRSACGSSRSRSTPRSCSCGRCAGAAAPPAPLLCRPRLAGMPGAARCASPPPRPAPAPAPAAAGVGGGSRGEAAAAAAGVHGGGGGGHGRGSASARGQPQRRAWRGRGRRPGARHQRRRGGRAFLQRGRRRALPDLPTRRRLRPACRLGRRGACGRVPRRARLLWRPPRPHPSTRARRRGAAVG